MKLISIACIAALMLSPALAQSPPADVEQYICTSELSGGLRWDNEAKRWTEASFRPDLKFLFTVSSIPDAATREFSSRLRRVNVKQFGASSLSDVCVSSTPLVVSEDPKDIYIDGDYTLSCAKATEYFKLNLKALRFMMIYPHGYIDGQDRSGNTPMINVGTCVKL